MEQVDQGKFACEQCGKTYKWKPDFAGRKVKCKCGFVMTAPQAPPGGDEPDLDALYDLADEGKQAAVATAPTIRCPSCKNELAPGSSLCAQCGFNLKTGKKGGVVAARGAPIAAARSDARGSGAGATGGGVTAVAVPGGGVGAFQAFGSPRKRVADEDRGEDKTLDWYVPIAILAVGMIVSVVHATSIGTVLVPMSQALMFTGLKLIIGVTLLAVASVFCIKWGEIAFGAPGPMALKLAAFAMGPPAIANLISEAIHDAPPVGWGLVGFFVAFGMFFVMSHYLFEWDMSEKWVVTGVATMVCMIATPFLFGVMLFGGHLGASRAEVNEDAFVAARIDMGRTIEAQQWLDGSGGRIVGDYGRGVGVDMVKDLYDLGAKEVLIQPDGPQAAEVIIRLPSDAKRRKGIFDWEADWCKKNSHAPVGDKGGKYLLMRFIPIADPPTL